jgi:transcription factor TFIIIB component B''
VRIDENGEVVVDEESLLVTQETDTSHDNYETVFESSNVINSHSFTKFKPTERWTKEDTEKFYKALQQYGSDFSLIAKLFPNRTRRQIRNKFKKEEKDNIKRVDWALTHRIPIGKTFFFLC